MPWEKYCEYGYFFVPLHSEIRCWMLDDGWRVLGNGVLGLVFEDKRFGDERLEMMVGR